MRLALALAMGLFVGLEREWRGKEAGLRTFGFCALLGGLGGLLGTPFALLSIALLGVLLCFLNWQSLRSEGSAELTTSAALCSHGTISPAVAGMGAIIASLASAVINFVLVARVSEHRPLTLRLGRALGVVVILGLAGAFVQTRLPGMIP